MLKDELLAEVRAASERLGAGPITERMIEDWITERLFEGPKPKGNRRGLAPTWVYSEEAGQRAVRIVELRAMGDSAGRRRFVSICGSTASLCHSTICSERYARNSGER